MKKKQPNKQFSDMTVKQLKSIADSCYHAIYISNCYGSSDCHNYIGSTNELAKRGYEVIEDKHLRIEKKDDFS